MKSLDFFIHEETLRKSGTINGNSNGSYISGAYVSGGTPQIYDVDDDTVTFITQDTVSLDVTHNTVNITGGTICGSVTGAYAYAGTGDLNSINANDALSYIANVSYNTVNFSGGTISAKGSNANTIFGGLYIGTTSNSSNFSIAQDYSVTNNTVNIGFGAKLGDNTTKMSLAGGAYYETQTSMNETSNLTPNVNTFDGNTLNIYHLQNSLSVNKVLNFENINFVLGAENTSAQLTSTSPLIDIDDTLYLGNGEGDNATKFANFGLHTSLYNTIATGDTVTLLSSTNAIDGYFANLDEDNSGTYTGTHGALLSRTWEITGSDTSMTAKLLSTQAGEQSKILGEVSLANMTAITNSTDLLVGSAIPTAYAQISSNLSMSTNSLDSQDSQNSGIIDNSAAATFMVTSGGSSRYNTGSHVDSNSISLNAGIAKGAKGMSGNWLVGGLF